MLLASALALTGCGCDEGDCSGSLRWDATLMAEVLPEGTYELTFVLDDRDVQRFACDLADAQTCVAIDPEDDARDVVFVGYEPSTQRFQATVLNEARRPVDRFEVMLKTPVGTTHSDAFSFMHVAEERGGPQCGACFPNVAVETTWSL